MTKIPPKPKNYQNTPLKLLKKKKTEIPPKPKNDQTTPKPKN